MKSTIPSYPLSTLPEMTAHMNAPLLDPHQRDVKADVARMRSGAYHLDVVAIISASRLVNPCLRAYYTWWLDVTLARA